LQLRDEQTDKQRGRLDERGSLGRGAEENDALKDPHCEGDEQTDEHVAGISEIELEVAIEDHLYKIVENRAKSD